jgi:hypothetical protein
LQFAFCQGKNLRLLTGDFSLFVLRLSPAPGAVLLELYFPFYFLLVLAGVKIAPFADVAPKDDKVI